MTHTNNTPGYRRYRGKEDKLIDIVTYIGAAVIVGASIVTLEAGTWQGGAEKHTTPVQPPAAIVETVAYTAAAPEDVTILDDPLVGHGPYEGITLTQAEADMLARLVWLEARGEDAAGQQGVAEVALNRLVSDRFPCTLEEVIYAPNQFSPAEYIDTTTAGEAQYEAVYAALSGTSPVLEPDVVYFSGAAQNDRIFLKIGNHWFCRI